jgi:ATP-dependent DNA ligase
LGQWVQVHTVVTPGTTEGNETLGRKRLPIREFAGIEGRPMGAGLTAGKMKGFRWLKPILVAQIEFTEWTGDNHLRHSKFIGLREDKKVKDVVREV